MMTDAAIIPVIRAATASGAAVTHGTLKVEVLSAKCRRCRVHTVDFSLPEVWCWRVSHTATRSPSLPGQQPFMGREGRQARAGTVAPEG